MEKNGVVFLGHSAISIRLRRVILLRRDIRYASFGRRIEYDCSVCKTISFAAEKISRCRRQHITKNYRVLYAERFLFGCESLGCL